MHSLITWYLQNINLGKSWRLAYCNSVLQFPLELYTLQFPICIQPAKVEGLGWEGMTPRAPVTWVLATLLHVIVPNFSTVPTVTPSSVIAHYTALASSSAIISLDSQMSLSSKCVLCKFSLNTCNADIYFFSIGNEAPTVIPSSVSFLSHHTASLSGSVVS